MFANRPKAKLIHRRTGLMLSLALIGFVGCAQDTDPTIRPDGGAAFPQPSSVASSPPPSPPVLTAASSPDQAAAALLDAWRAGDRPAAGRVAPAPAVEALFARPPAVTQGRECDQGTSQSRDCVYRLGSSLLRVTVVANPTGGWTVSEVEVS